MKNAAVAIVDVTALEIEIIPLPLLETIVTTTEEEATEIITREMIDTASHRVGDPLPEETITGAEDATGETNDPIPAA